MERIQHYRMRSDRTVSWINLFTRSMVMCAILFGSSSIPLKAQNMRYTKPTWTFGAAVGANINFNSGSTQDLSSTFTAPVAFSDGHGVGLFAAPLVQYHMPESIWGFMLQAGYDSRKSAFDQETAPCNCPADLSTDLDYIAVEPSLRVAPFKNGFHLYGGPRLAFNMNKSFAYHEDINPDFPNQLPNPDESGDMDHVNKTLLSMQVGAGYDIPVSGQDQRTQYVFSPFISFHPYFGQTPRTNENWEITTVRIGAALKIGHGQLIPNPPATAVMPVMPEVRFSVNSPKNIPQDRNVREIFPVSNYVFFDEGSTAIPARYDLLRKDQVKNFKEDNLEVNASKKPAGRSVRQMEVYYNVLNILGDRMGKDLTTNVTLVGSSEKDPEEGKLMAEAIKKYLVDIFDIAATRITAEGRSKPKIPSEQPGATLDLGLLRSGDRRVSIESTSPALLMEFQSGPDAPLKPVEIVALQKAPVDSYITFTVDGAKTAFTSWSLEFKDEKGMVQNFGPYTQEVIRLPGNYFLGSRSEGDFKVTMIGTTKNGQIVRKETPVHMVLWTPASTDEGMRYSVLYEFNESRTITLYEKYLTEIVAPKIPMGGKVIIHGHTDIIGDEAYNQTLSTARANDVKGILEKALVKAGRNDVSFEVYGFGEDESLSPFENVYPEERFYNRTVIIDIIAGK